MISSKSGLHLINWYGQNLYEMNEGIICSVLDEDKMELREKEEGQLNIFFFKKE